MLYDRETSPTPRKTEKETFLKKVCNMPITMLDLFLQVQKLKKKQFFNFRKRADSNRQVNIYYSSRLERK